MKHERDVDAAPVNEEPGFQSKSPATHAGGWSAVIASQKFIIRDLGFLSGNRALLRMNQRQGFDCPGCAWPDPDGKRSVAEFCENGAKALGEEATDRLIGREFFRQHCIEELSRWSDFELGQAGRIAEPLYLRPQSKHYEPISWQSALQIIAEKLQSIEPNEAIFYTSGRTSNEAAYVYQLFARTYGTNNLPDCSNLCHESSGLALSQSIGIGKGTVKLEDFDKSDLILVIGQNPGTNHPRMLATLRAAVKRGAAVISINPLFEAGLKQFRHPQHLEDMLGKGVDLASQHLAIRINGDLALFQGIAKRILDRHPDGCDTKFIRDKTEGFAAYKTHIGAVSWQDIEQQSGLSRQSIEALADRIMQARGLISCWAMGLTQQPQAVETIQELTNLHLLGGFIGRPGSGLCPVRGHSNVQGDRSMGICERPPTWIDRLEAHYQLAVPRQAGYDVVNAIQAMADKRAKALVCLGGNFLSAAPDTLHTAKAISNLDLSVQISTKLNRSHLISGEAALILPCLARSERDLQGDELQFVTVENSMGYLHRSQGHRRPRSTHWQSEVAIICQLAAECLPKSQIPWMEYARRYDRIRQDIEAVIPGFEGMRSKLTHADGFYLPNLPRDAQQFPTSSGLARFSIATIDWQQVAANRYILMTIRSHDQFNTTIYGMDDRYRGVFQGRRVVLMNAKDMQKQGFLRNQEIDICSHFQGETRWGRRFRVLPYEIPQGMLASYFPEANILVPLKSFAKGSQTPTSKYLEVSLHQSP